MQEEKRQNLSDDEYMKLDPSLVCLEEIDFSVYPCDRWGMPTEETVTRTPIPHTPSPSPSPSWDYQVGGIPSEPDFLSYLKTTTSATDMVLYV